MQTESQENRQELQEDELLAQAVAGDHAALSVLLRHHGAQLCRGLKIGRKWQSVVDVDDVMQVTYLEAFLHIRSFTPARPGSFRAWLRRIAANNLRDAIKGLEADKRPQNRAFVSPIEDSYTRILEDLTGSITRPTSQAVRNENQGLVESALRQLPPDYEKVIRLCELEQRSGPEVAEMMGRNHGAIKMLLGRARVRLKEILGSGSKFFSRSA